MVQNNEISEASSGGQITEQEQSGQLYGEIIYKEATSLLGKYLPEAQPQEPTEMFIGIAPQYMGMFSGKHCVALERDVQLDPVVQIMEKGLKELQLFGRRQELAHDLERERFRLWDNQIEKGGFDPEVFEEIDRSIDEQKEAIWQMPMPEPETKAPPKDWEEPEKLLEGPGQFSVDSWRNVYMLVHELVHQKQAELNPSEFPVLTSPELEKADPNMSHNELYDLLLEAHKADSRTHSNDSLFYPVIEGMAVLGSFYVMGRSINDLTASGETEIADKVRQVRRSRIYDEIVVNKRKEGAGGSDSYSLNYPEGLGIMKKLYKQFGLENIPRILGSVDLSACRQVTKGSPQYQQMIKNPALLPGLSRAT